MTDLQIFNNPEFGEIRAVEVDGEPWFVGKDMATALGYSNPRDSLAKHVDDEDKNTVAFCDGTPGNPNLTIINESGVYSLIFSSRLEKAKEFKRWVTAEVLPTIRKHGAYIAPGAAPQGLEAATLQAVLQPIAATMEALTAAVQTLNQRMDVVEQGRNELKALPPGGEQVEAAPGVASQKRWMRTVSEKLDLLSARYNRPHNIILSKIYKDMEEEFETVMEDERYRTMEEQGLEKCSVLTAIFFDPELRAYFQQYVDYNLAPENRGW